VGFLGKKEKLDNREIDQVYIAIRQLSSGVQAFRALDVFAIAIGA
jgi:hypothetical protein